MRILLIPALLSTVVSCSGSGGDPIDGTSDVPVGTQRDPIISGTPDPGHPAVVYLHSLVFSGTHVVGGAGDCTGTLIYPETILTAAHCIKRPSGQDRRIYVYINDDFAAGRPFSAQAADVTWDPAATGGVDQHDIGLVFLSAPLAGITPIPLYTGPVEEAGTVPLVIGYGELVAGQTQSSRYSGLASITGYSGGMYITSPIACRGDSGGPMLTWFGAPNSVISVASGGDCRGASRFVDVLRHSDWINQLSYAWAVQH